MTGLETLEATVMQGIYAGETLLEESWGRFAMAPPLLLWQIDEPFPQILLLDEERLQIYDQDLGQLTIQSLSNASAPMPVDLLMRPDRLADGDYTVTRQIVDDEQIYRLAPRASSSLFQALDIVLLDGVLTTLVIHDWQGQQTRLAFDNVSVNQPLPATKFQLVVPEGTDVIRG
jgi:outer membrane lipoprotein carrier protein